MIVDAANLRSGPGRFYPFVVVARMDDTLAVLGKTADGEWLKAETVDGRIVWVWSALVQASKPLDEVAVVESPPTPTPPRLAAPVLLEPKEGTVFGVSDQIVLWWRWNNALEPSDVFAVQIWYEGDQESTILEWLRDTRLTVDMADKPSGQYNWIVSVVRFSEAGEFPVSQTSETRSFTLLPKPTPIPTPTYPPAGRGVCDRDLPVDPVRPVAIAPDDGAVFGPGKKIGLAWNWCGAFDLAQGDLFSVRVWPQAGPEDQSCAHVRADEAALAFDPADPGVQSACPGVHKFSWSVQVVSPCSSGPDCSEGWAVSSQPSEPRGFCVCEWPGCSSCPYDR